MFCLPFKIYTISECAGVDEPVPTADRLPQPGVLAGHHVHPGLHLTAPLTVPAGQPGPAGPVYS